MRADEPAAAVPANDPPGASDSATAPPAGDSTASGAATPPGEPQVVDFYHDVRPIFLEHCIKCHGPEKRSGGLRLDEREHASEGGDSGKAILAEPLEDNELYARVSSSDRTYRMPKNAEPLPAADVAKIKRWIELGAPWPIASDQAQAKIPPFYSRWLTWVEYTADRHKRELAVAMPYAYVFLALQVLLLVISRAKRDYQQSVRWTQGRLGAVARWSSRVSTRELLLLWCGTLALMGFGLLWGHEHRLEDDLAKARASQAMAADPWTKNIFGFPPKPFRPDHPPRVVGRYYRGNCERNEQLFNAGNYLTSTFDVSLCDARRQPLAVGDAVPEDGVFVRLEIERAPGTSKTLFSKEMMSSVYLTTTFFGRESPPTMTPLVQLETLEEEHRWVAYYPLGPIGSAGVMQGLIYVYTGRLVDDRLRGEPHYGIGYELHQADGKLTADSDLWMNSFGNLVFQPPEQPGKLPYREWFDHRPMPVITGPNSQDPKLLGIEEYIRKGLITPKKGAEEKEEQGEKEPASDGAKTPGEGEPATKGKRQSGW